MPGVIHDFAAIAVAVLGMDDSAAVPDLLNEFTDLVNVLSKAPGDGFAA